MRRLKSLVVTATLVCTVLAPVETRAQSSSSTEALDLVEVAHRLVDFGYRSLGPQALLMAAQIAMDYQARQLNARPNELIRGARGADTLPAFDVEELLARAEGMAAGDSTIMTMSARLRARLRGTTRGVLRGPRLGSYTIDGGGTHEFTLTFATGEPAVVRVRASTATNLSCAILDARGRTMREDRSTSYCVLNFRPETNGTVKVRITSAATSPSAYMLITN